MKKIVSVVCAVVLCLCATLSLVACNTQKEEESKVMNVSLNPEVEFILDGENKVVSVNAKNEEGNLVINGTNFTGLDADKAVELYVSVCKETGFIVTGNVKDGENNISISFSGDDAQKYYDEISAKVQSYLSEENIQATLKKGADLTQEYIDSLLAECAPYIDEARLEALSYMEKIEALAESRKETAEMYSQELKNAYYQAKADAFNHAKFEAAKEKAGAIQGAIISGLTTAYDTACETIEKLRAELLVNADSAYQKSLVAFREAKTAYLNYRQYVAENEVDGGATELESLKTALDNAEAALVSAGEAANQGLTTAKAALTSAYNAVVEAIANAGVEINNIIDESETTINSALDTFETSFATTYATAVEGAKSSWNAMKKNLETGYVAAPAAE